MSGAYNAQDPSIEVHNLSYKFPDGNEGLKDIELDLPAGSRTLLIGGETAPLYPVHHSS